MAELRYLVVAGDAVAADQLLGVVPAGTVACLALLGHRSDEVRADLCELPFARIVAVPQAAPGVEPSEVGTLLRDYVAEADVVVLDSSQSSRDIAGWVCASLDLPLVWAIDALRATGNGIEADRVVLGGSHRLVHRVPTGRPVVVMAKPTSAASAQGRRGDGAPVVVVHSAELAPPRVRVLSAADATAAGRPLAAARIVISVGRGIGSADRVPLFRELADAVGAALGASRVAVDSGWVPFAHQVGQTGTAVAPDVYVAFGISGAIQHLAGMRGSKRVVAVNTDAEAPLCRTADLVVNADAVQVAEALLRRVGVVSSEQQLAAFV